MSNITFYWDEPTCSLQVINSLNSSKNGGCICFSNEFEICLAIKNGEFSCSQDISIVAVYAILMTATRHVNDDKYEFMDRFYDTVEMLKQHRSERISLNATLQRIMGLAFISATPSDMQHFISIEAKLIQNE